MSVKDENIDVIPSILLDVEKCLKQFNHKLSTWGSTFVGVLTVRPNLAFNEKVVWADDYNYTNEQNRQHTLSKNRRRGKPKKDAVINLHANNNRVKNEGKKFNDPIIETSYYHVLSGLIDDCDEFNKMTDSKIDPSLCVKKITSLVDETQVEAMNFRDILMDYRITKQENERLILKENTSKSMAELETKKMVLESEIVMLKKKYHDSKPLVSFKQSIDATTETDIIGTPDTLLDSISRISYLNGQADIKKHIKKEKWSVQRNILAKSQFMMNQCIKTISNEAKEWSFEVSPQSESIACGKIIPDSIKPIVDPIIKSLIVKASKGSEVLQELGNKMAKILQNLFRNLTFLLSELD
jgi:hypothetical protein